MRLGYAIFTVATLSFLGFGVQPPAPDWGLRSTSTTACQRRHWWPSLFPALAIATLVISVNLMADGMRRPSSDERAAPAASGGRPALELDDLDVGYRVRGI